jgi:hypothetical protein
MGQISCPQCGAPVKFESAASVMVVCGSCRSTLLKDADSVRRIGEMAEVLEDYSPIQIGSTGKYLNKRFDVVGRLQLRYDAGFWNEWYVYFEDGRDGWLSDASGQYAVTRTRAPQAKDPVLPAFNDVKPGAELRFDGKTYYAADIRRCRAVAGQGELPFTVGASGYEAVVADFRAMADFLTLDYSDAAVPQVYQGHAFDLDDMQRGSLRADYLIDETAGNYVGAIKALECPSCGGPISFAAAVATQVVCPSCRAAVDCSGATAQVLEKRKKVEAIVTTLKLGAKAVIDEVPYTLIGLMKCEDPDPEDGSEWVEYLLHSPRRGFLWLVEAEDEWERVRVCDTWPVRIDDRKFSYAGRPFDFKYDYESKVKVALGAFNWRVQAGDSTRITDFMAGYRKLTRETTASELGWSISGKIDAEEVAGWFKPRTASESRKASEVRTKAGLAKRRKGDLSGPAILAIAAMIFFNIGSIMEGHLLGPIIGGVFLWMPVWVQSKLRGKV